MVILRGRSLWSNLLDMLLRGSHLRCVFCDELFTNSSRVHVLGLPSLVALSPPLASHPARLIPPCSLRRLGVVLSFLPFMLMKIFWLGVMTLVFLLRRLIYSNTSAFVTWGVLDTFLGSIFLIRKGSSLWPNGSMPFTCLRRHNFLGSSQRPHPWKLADSFGIIRLHSLRMLTAIGDCWASWYISLSLASTLYTRLVSWVRSCRNLDEFTGRELYGF